MTRLIGIWAAIYPVVAHLGLWTSHSRLVVAYLVGLLLLVLLYPPRFLQLKNSLLAIVVLTSVLLLAQFDLEYMLIYLPPAVIPSVLFIIFMRSLGNQSIPLITRFASKIEGRELDEKRKHYTRRVTQVWTVVFALMVFEAIGLAIWAPIEVWSWFTHIGNYVLIALLLVVEFVYRQHIFETNKTGFRQFITALVNYRWQ